MHIAIWPILLIVLIGAIIGLWFFIRSLASQNVAQRVGIGTMVIGAIGIAWHLMILITNRHVPAQHAVFLLPGAIVFGCGAIATAIGQKK